MIMHDSRMLINNSAEDDFFSLSDAKQSRYVLNSSCSFYEIESLVLTTISGCRFGRVKREVVVP